jgi:hypothetical protein
MTKGRFTAKMQRARRKMAGKEQRAVNGEQRAVNGEQRAENREQPSVRSPPFLRNIHRPKTNREASAPALASLSFFVPFVSLW